jgi:hypothetical protein
MGFMDNLAGMLGYGPSQQAAQSTNVARANQATQLQQEYEAAKADPNSGVGLSPAMQAQQENELGNHIRGQMSDQGAGGSGANNDAVQKGIVDYRIAQMGKHMQYLDNLRQGMLTASTPQVQQPTAGQSAVSRFTTQAAGSAANDLFGPDYGDPNQRGGMNVTINSPSPGTNPQGRGPLGTNGTPSAGNV